MSWCTIKHAMGYNCGEGKTGEFGAFVTELPRGASYKFRFGAQDASRAIAAERHESRDDATRQHFEDSSAMSAMSLGLPSSSSRRSATARPPTPVPAQRPLRSA
eukprot:7383858-Pyramimonas_sp.AAC.1